MSLASLGLVPARLPHVLNCSVAGASPEEAKLSLSNSAAMARARG